MIARRFSVWQKLVALAPLLLLAVYLPGQVLLRCRFDGLLRPACCCPTEAEAQDSGPVVKALGCCDREITVNARPAAEPARISTGDVTSAAAAALPVALISFVLPEPGRSQRAGQAHGPLRQGPPIVPPLLKHAFLI